MTVEELDWRSYDEGGRVMKVMLYTFIWTSHMIRLSCMRVVQFFFLIEFTFLVFILIQAFCGSIFRHKLVKILSLCHNWILVLLVTVWILLVSRWRTGRVIYWWWFDDDFINYCPLELIEMCVDMFRTRYVQWASSLYFLQQILSREGNVKCTKKMVYIRALLQFHVIREAENWPYCSTHACIVCGQVTASQTISNRKNARMHVTFDVFWFMSQCVLLKIEML